MNPTHTTQDTALIVVDVQNDFCEGGSLAVEGGAAVAAKISRYITDTWYAFLAYSMDEHINPGSHFASFDKTEPDYNLTWPNHCQINTKGAEFHPNLIVPKGSHIFRKGHHSAAYSAFEGTSNGRALFHNLKIYQIKYVHVVGIALDYCVKATAIDAANNGFETTILGDMCAAVNKDEDKIDELITDLKSRGVRYVATTESIFA